MIDKSKFSDKERVVYELIEGGDRITQLEICRNARFLGCLEKYEGHLPIDKESSTLRQIRGIVRSLRMEHNCPIVSGIDGYFIPKSDDEVKEYIARMEAISRAQAKSWRDTYFHMVKVFGDSARSDYFESQGTLFD